MLKISYAFVISTIVGADEGSSIFLQISVVIFAVLGDVGAMSSSR